MALLRVAEPNCSAPLRYKYLLEKLLMEGGEERGRVKGGQ